MTTEKWEFSMKSQMGITDCVGTTQCAHRYEEHKNRKSDQSILHLAKAMPMEECNRTNSITMVRGDVS